MESKRSALETNRLVGDAEKSTTQLSSPMESFTDLKAFRKRAYSLLGERQRQFV